MCGNNWWVSIFLVFLIKPRPSQFMANYEWDRRRETLDCARSASCHFRLYYVIIIVMIIIIFIIIRIYIISPFWSYFEVWYRFGNFAENENGYKIRRKRPFLEIQKKTWSQENIICVTQYSWIFFRSETIRNKHESRNRIYISREDDTYISRLGGNRSRWSEEGGVKISRRGVHYQWYSVRRSVVSYSNQTFLSCLILTSELCLKLLSDSLQPYFPSIVENVTVSYGRKAVLKCEVENLRNYKVTRIIDNMDGL